MAQIVLYGFAPSTYTRTARMVLAEKGLPYTMEEVTLGSPDHLAINPFGRIPMLRHGERRLFETLAIAGYVDEEFDGPSLQPPDCLGRATMRQWISAHVDSVYPTLVRAYLMPYVRAAFRGTEPDRAAIDAAVDDVGRMLRILDGRCGEAAYFAGDALSLADLFVFPVVFYMRTLPESAEAMAGLPHLNRWYDGVAQRPSAVTTVPPPVG